MVNKRNGVAGARLLEMLPPPTRGAGLLTVVTASRRLLSMTTKTRRGMWNSVSPNVNRSAFW
jgi:hypothetical protein